MHHPQMRPSRAAIILAGGDGTRLKPVTRRITGADLPKQFCPIIGERTLLDDTRLRTSLMFPSSRTMMVLNRDHEEFYAPLVGDLPARNLVVQPSNRGTAAAILYALVRAELNNIDSVAIFPSDHYVGDDARFMHHVEAAFGLLAVRPELTVLLGVEADCPEDQYGWIEPDGKTPIWHSGLGAISRIRRFWEKPARHVATQLWSRACLWNSFVMVARVSTLMGLFQRAMPRLHTLFQTVLMGTPIENRAVKALYSFLPESGFSEQILTRFAHEMAVLPMSGVPWSDLGEPNRLARVLSQLGRSPAWLESA